MAPSLTLCHVCPQGLTVFGVANDEVLTLLEQLKKKQAMLARERPEVAEIISRRPQPTYRRRSVGGHRAAEGGRGRAPVSVGNCTLSLINSTVVI